MYSRKYVRPSGALPPSIDRPTPPPDYAGVVFRPASTPAAEDFPETIIPSVEPLSDRSDEVPSLSEAVDRPLASLWDEPMPEGMDTESPLPSEDEPTLSKANDPEEVCSPEDTDPPDADDGSESDEPSSASPENHSPDSVESVLEWLKNLKVEDMLLIWMLLRLIYGEAEEELELLLGLLLLTNG